MSWPANNALTTPRRNEPMADKPALDNGAPANSAEDTAPALDPRYAEFAHRFAWSEARLLALLQGRDGPGSRDTADDAAPPGINGDTDNIAPGSKGASAPAARKPARAIDEDDYGDDDEEEDTGANDASGDNAHEGNSAGDAGSGGSKAQEEADGAAGPLAAEAQPTEESAKRKFRDYFFTLESDRDAMLEQQRLDAMEAQIAAETSGQSAVNGNLNGMATQSVESLSSTNLGATSLVMKNLFRRIDEKRSQIRATDTEIRNIIRDVRKGRSKWASDDKVNQEELYEAAEQVLNSLKAEAENVGPFLQKVNKREAPDYYQVIKHPMDLGTMFKKLKNLAYKSKKDFVHDLNLIWANCLHYNGDPKHPLRKNALYMRKRSEELLQHVPDVVIRDRAEVEAEERRRQKFEIGLGGEEDSDDEEPIMASRGRKAPKKGATARKQVPSKAEETPVPEAKPALSHAASSAGLREDFLRPDSEAPATNGFTTPPPGSITPLGPHGAASSVVHGSQADASEMMDIVGEDSTLGPAGEPEVDDPDLKAWKQATKKGRARVAITRHKLFRGDKLNAEEAALLRSKAGMRKWLRQQMESGGDDGGDADVVNGRDGAKAITGETIAEGLEDEEEGYLPDYYYSLSAIPDLEPRLRWEEDSEGHATAQVEETLRVLPSKGFVSSESNLAKKMEANMKQMQETRKLCAKIGVVKQMQLQQQMYQNQFQKYSPTPLMELDIGPQVVSDEGPLMAPWVCRTALQRSVGKIFYHAGFEEFQPSALEAVTDLASDYFERLVSGLVKYREEPLVRNSEANKAAGHDAWRPMYTRERSILHALHSTGLEMESLETYVKDDVDRLETKLGVMHDRMRAHLAELLRPALNADAGVDGAGAFADGSEEFVSGDFAQDMDEDFFGFKDLGLDKEFGLSTLSVPLHLLQNRMYSLNQQQNTGATSATGNVMEPPPAIEPVTVGSIAAEIGLVQDFFLQKLHAGSDEPLVEDDDLPVKQRFPKPRLPPTGKITSPRKRPIREQQQLAKKKRKLEEAAANGEGPNSADKGLGKPLEKKLRLEMPRDKENVHEPEKDDAAGSPTGMMSPPDSM